MAWRKRTRGFFLFNKIHTYFFTHTNNNNHHNIITMTTKTKTTTTLLHTLMACESTILYPMFCCCGFVSCNYICMLLLFIHSGCKNGVVLIGCLLCDGHRFQKLNCSTSNSLKLDYWLTSDLSVKFQTNLITRIFLLLCSIWYFFYLNECTHNANERSSRRRKNQLTTNGFTWNSS